MYKICMIAPIPFFEDRGAPIRVYGEAKGLANLGHEIDVVCYHLGRAVPEVHRIHRIHHIPWYNTTAAGPSYHKVYLDLMVLSKALHVIKSYDVDVVHAHLHEGAAIAQMLNAILKLKKPVIFDAQGSLTGEMASHGFLKPTSLQFRFWRWLENKICDNSSFILASSHHLLRLLRYDFRIPEEKTALVLDGVDTDLFNPKRFDREKIRHEFDLANDDVIIYTGLFSRYQGLNFLIEDVVPRVVKENKNAKFVLIGYPAKEYIKLAKNARVHENILFMGKQRYADVPKFLAAADIAVTPKRMEMGEANLKVLTYMAMGLPTIAFNYEYNTQLLQDGGLTTEPGDVNGFTDAIINLLCNPKQRRMMGKKARSLAQNKHSWLSVASKLVDVYRKLSDEK